MFYIQIYDSLSVSFLIKYKVEIKVRIFYTWIPTCFKVFGENTAICSFNCLFTFAKKSMSHIFGGLFLDSWFCFIDRCLYQIHSRDHCSIAWVLTFENVIPSTSVLFALLFPFYFFAFSFKFQNRIILSQQTLTL